MGQNVGQNMGQNMGNNMGNNNGPVKYKTMLCKHYDSSKGCVYGEKCQFAHGAQELKSTMNVIFYLLFYI